MTISQAALSLALLALLSCNQSRDEPQAPGEVKGDRLQVEKNSQDAVGGRESRAFTPAQIRRDYLKGLVLDETTTNGSTATRVGLKTYFNGRRIAENPSQYKVSLSVASVGADPLITLTQAASSGEFDHIITLKGPTADRIEDAYEDIRIFTMIVDTTDNSSVSLSPAISDVLTSTRPRSRTAAFR